MNTNRAKLLQLATLVQPALSSQGYIPALSHILFSVERGRVAVAYNDVAAILVSTDLGLELCVPGELLVKTLGSFSAEDVSLQVDDKTGNLHVVSGRSKMKLPTLAAKEFPLELPDGDCDKVEVTDSMLEGIRRCLFSVGSDPTHPAQMGITVDTHAGKACFYSTDNFTITVSRTNSKIKLPGDSPIILPTFFCEQLLRLAKHFHDVEIVLRLYPGAIMAEFGKRAVLLSKTLVDVEPMDYPAVLKKYLDLEDLGDAVMEVPTALDAAFGRALLVMSQEADKSTKVTTDREGLALFSTSQTGQADDYVGTEKDIPKRQQMEFNVDPVLVMRGLKLADHMAFYKRVLVLASKDLQFVHLIAHCAA